MKIRDFASLLVEKDRDDELDPLVTTFNDRLLLRIFNSPSLLSSLVDNSTLKKDGEQIVELSFKQLPDDIIPQVKLLIGAPLTAIKVVRFRKEHLNYTGFRVTFTGEDLKKARETAKKGTSLLWYTM